MRLTFRQRSNTKAMVAAASASAAFTAGLFLFLGPGGRRRRGLARNRVTHLRHVASTQLDKAARDLERRTEGVLARARGTTKVDVDDVVLAERARAALGHVCSHPHALKTSVEGGLLTLEGPVLVEERRAIVGELRKVPGIRAIRDALDLHDAPDVPALQGGRHRERRPELLQDNWSPVTRLAVGMAGAGMLIFAVANRRAWGVAGGALGGLLVLRAIANRSAREALGGPFVVHKSIFIRAPKEEVFEMFRRVERFPRFMTHVKEVRRIDNQRYLWRIDGPFGAMTATCELTAWQPSEAISWASVVEASARNGEPRIEGHVRFIDQEGGTRLDVALSFRLPIGAIGYALAKARKRDPKTLLDDDLLRLKSLLENGKATGRGAQVSLDEIEGEAVAPW